MLKQLVIRNYALIKELELSPSSGLNVITGETGAGKSIMLGALGLLMGNRADTKVLGNENEKCITEATFDIHSYKLHSLFQQAELDYEDLTVLRREISPAGKSRAFINDTPVTLDVMKQFGSRLMDIHSQHETLLLAHQNFQLDLIDAYAGNQIEKDAYRGRWENYLNKKYLFDKLSSEADTLREEADYIHFQLDELNKASFEKNEQLQLEEQVKIIDHAEEIKSRLQQILQLVDRSEYAISTTLTEAVGQLSHLISFGKHYETLHDRLESLRIELTDIIHELEDADSKVDFDPENAELIKERLSEIYRLQKKHRVNTLDELLAIQAELAEKAKLTSNLDEALNLAKKELEVAKNELNDSGKRLTKSRSKIFDTLVNEIVSLLKTLGIPEAQIKFQHDLKLPHANGMDDINLMFSANKGVAPQPLQQVASGGEFSRLMFCVKYVMAAKTSMPTLILDEIDSGISGEIAIKLGNLMKSMASNHQLITITHLPQIAAKGESHYFVYKDSSSTKAISKIKRLTEAERVHEIAQMIGGEKPSAVSLASAKELLA